MFILFTTLDFDEVDASQSNILFAFFRFEAATNAASKYFSMQKVVVNRFIL